MTLVDDLKSDMTTHHVIAGHDEAGSEADRIALSNIEVGTLADVTVKNDVMAISKASGDLPKLTGDNFLVWRSEILRMVVPIHEGRAVGLLNGTVKGSLEAYRRYYGTDGVDGDPNDETIKAKKAKLQSVGKATLFRGTEEQQIRTLLLSTMSETAKNGLSQYHEGPVSNLWKAIESRYAKNSAMARNYLKGQMFEFDPTGKSMVEIVDGLANLFREYQLCTGEAIEEQEKVVHLHHAVKKAEKGNSYIISWTTRAHEKLDDINYTFEKAYNELKRVDEDLNKSKDVTAHFNPNMFVAQQVSHYNGGDAQMDIHGGGMFGAVQTSQYPYGSNHYSSQGPMRQYGQPMQGVRQMFQRGPDGCWHCGRAGHSINRCRDRENGKPTIYPNGIPNVGVGGTASHQVPMQQFPRPMQMQQHPSFQSVPAGQGYSNINQARQPLPPQPSTIKHNQQDDSMASLHTAMSNFHFEAAQAKDNSA